MMAMIALRGVLPSKCKSLKSDLQNQHNLGNNQHPTDLNQVMKELQNHVSTKSVTEPAKEGGGGLRSHQSDEAQVKGSNGKLRMSVKYRKCERLGHFQTHCPFVNKEENEVERSSHFQTRDPSYIIA